MAVNFRDFFAWDEMTQKEILKRWHAMFTASFPIAMSFKERFPDLKDISLEIVSGEDYLNYTQIINDENLRRFNTIPSRLFVYKTKLGLFHVGYSIYPAGHDPNANLRFVESLHDDFALDIISNRPEIVQIVNVILVSSLVVGRLFLESTSVQRGVIATGSTSYGFEAGVGKSIFCGQNSIRALLKIAHSSRKKQERLVDFAISSLIHELVHLISIGKGNDSVMAGHLNEIVTHMTEFLWKPNQAYFTDRIAEALQKIRAAYSHKNVNLIDEKYDIALLVMLVFVVSRLRKYPIVSRQEIKRFDSLSLDEQFEVLARLHKIMMELPQKEREHIAREVRNEFLYYSFDTLAQLYLQVEHELNMKVRLSDLR